MSLDMGQYPSVSRAEQTTSYTGGFDSFEAVDFRSRQALSAGTASISSSLRSSGAFSSRCSRWSRCLPLQSTLFSSLKDFFSQKSNSFPV